MKRPETAVLRYVENADDCAPHGPEHNELEIEVCDAGAGPYLVIHTARWAIEDPNELAQMLRHALDLCDHANPQSSTVT